MYRLARRGIPAALLFCLGIAACGSDESGEDYAVYEADNTQQCSTQVVEGLDVYSGDGTINWNEVAASGRDFVFIKATQGNYNKQTNFATNWAGAQAAGVLRSPYHFFDATIDGVTQANWYLAEPSEHRGQLRIHRQLRLGRHGDVIAARVRLAHDGATRDGAHAHHL